MGGIKNAHNFKDLTGKRFNMLTVIKRANNSKNGTARWHCLCDCGNETIVAGTKLRNESTKSCGCYRKRQKGYSKTRLYNIWQSMNARCYKENNDNFKWYGGQGIEICDDWKDDFLSFRIWALENGYRNDLSIDRVDVNGNYEPTNCRWVSQKDQMNNVSSNKMISYNDVNYTQSQLADEFGLKYHTIRNRLRAGWSVEKIVSTPEVEDE